MDAPTAPLFYREPLVTKVYEPLEPEWGDDFPFFPTKLGMFTGSTDTTWAILRRLLAGNEELTKVPFSGIYPVVRAEFIYDQMEPGRERRGLVLWDSSNKGPLLHAKHALLGYGGSGPSLSEAIMLELGVSQEMFNEANEAVRDRESYIVVFSRHELALIEGVMAAIPYHVSDEWQFWVE